MTATPFAHRLYLDIETLPALGWSDAERLAFVAGKVPGNYKKPETIAAWIEGDEGREAFERTSCDWRHLQLYGVCAAFDDREPVSFGFHPPEHPLDAGPGTRTFSDQVLLDLTTWLEAVALPFNDESEEWGRPSQQVGWYTWNGRSFDLPILRLHALRHDDVHVQALSERIPHEKWDIRCRDVKDRWAGGLDRMGFHMGDAVRFLRMPTWPDDITGKDVYSCFLRGEHARVERHCLADVTTLRSLAQRLRY